MPRLSPIKLMDTPTSFSPNCLVSGCGYVAMGGETADLLIRSVDIHSRWESKIYTGQSIVNSVCFYQVSDASNPQILVCNNDQTITQYDVSSVSSSTIYNEATDSLSADPAHRSTLFTDCTPTPISTSSTSNRKPTLTLQGCINLPVPVNHCSVSPDRRSVIAVGDSNEVFLYDCQNPSGTNEPLIANWQRTSRNLYLPGVSPSTGSFSTSWNQTGDKFAVASEGQVVVVYDTRMVPRPILVKRTSQRGRAGGARVVKFSPEGPTDLLAFSEHQSLVHVLDARTFDPDHEETLTVPTPLPGLNPFPPRLSRSSVFPQMPSHQDSEQTQFEQEDTRSSTSARMAMSRFSALLAFRNRTGPFMDTDSRQQEPEQEEEEEGEEEGEGAAIRGGEDEQGDQLMRDGSTASSSRLAPVADGRILERLWGEIAEDDDEISRNQQIGLRTGASSSSNWIGTRSGLGNLTNEDEEVCLEPETVVGQTAPIIQRTSPPTSSSSPSSSRRVPYGLRALPPPSTTSVSPSFRQIQIRGSSVRLFRNPIENERRAIVNQSVTPAISGIQTSLLSNRLGMGRPPTGTAGDVWFDPNTHHPNQPTIIGVRSGLWDDLIGLSWSPDGNYLMSGTEAGLVEWKVDRSSRTGFGDTRLC